MNFRTTAGAGGNVLSKTALTNVTAITPGVYIGILGEVVDTVKVLIFIERNIVEIEYSCICHGIVEKGVSAVGGEPVVDTLTISTIFYGERVKVGVVHTKPLIVHIEYAFLLVEKCYDTHTIV